MKKDKLERIYKEFLDDFTVLDDIRSVSTLLSWDQEVLIPEKGVDARSRVQKTISTLSHQKMIDKELINRFNILKENEDLLSDVQSRCIGKFYESAAHEWKLSTDLVADIAKTTSIAKRNWAEAKKEKSFEKFAPYLEKIIYLKQKEAEQVGFDNHPYDALLDTYEPGITCKVLDSLFENLIPIIKQYRESFAQKTSDINTQYEIIDPDKQFVIAKEMIKKIGFDFKKGRIDIGLHPSTEAIHEGDVRIIARVDKSTINTGIFLTLHELGHALYYQNIDLKYSGTPLYEGASTAMHEAQAKLWENFIAKSVPFWEGNYSHIKNIINPKIHKLNVNEFVLYINKISNSPIRFDADELSFIIHIYVRYIIEKKLIEGSIDVKEVPEVWNSMMKEHLNIDVFDDSSGCLQDIHWADGLIGYFPTYVIGSIYATQIYQAMKKEINDYENLLKQSDFSPIIKWLKTNVYSFGAYYTAPDLIKKISGESNLNYSYFIEYIKSKYEELYK